MIPGAAWGGRVREYRHRICLRCAPGFPEVRGFSSGWIADPAPELWWDKRRAPWLWAVESSCR